MIDHKRGQAGVTEGFSIFTLPRTIGAQILWDIASVASSLRDLERPYTCLMLGLY